MTSPEQKAYRRLFETATGGRMSPYDWQVRLARSGPLPPLLEMPTGCGKTAGVVLAWLYRRRFHADADVRRSTARRLVYCLPMRTLVDQVATDVERWLAQLAGVLSPDGCVTLHRLLGGDVDDDWTDAPDGDAILVGTQDMLLSRALNRGYGLGRRAWPKAFGLLHSDCHWVLDEVQLMGVGASTSAQLDGLRAGLGTFGPSGSTWMSATLDPRLVATVDHPAPCTAFTLDEDDRAEKKLAARLQATKPLSTARTILAGTDRDSLSTWASALAAEIASAHAPGRFTLAVVNTVQRACTLHGALMRIAAREASAESELPPPLLLHSRFRLPDRERILAALREPSPESGRIVVATQVVEAGMDLSADHLFTELAPWASVVQRLGRCNRDGRSGDPAATWVDVDTGDAKRAAALALPYEVRELEQAREHLERLEDGRPADLPRALQESDPHHVLRRRDLLELFDTTPDLAGAELDVSRFVRDTDDRSCQVFWRTTEPDWNRKSGARQPPKELARPRHEETCAVPIGELRGFLERTRKAPGTNGWTWDFLDGAWHPVSPKSLHPGMTVLLRADLGGYDATRGWDPAAKGVVECVPARGAPQQALDGDQRTFAPGCWVELPDHSSHVAAGCAALGRALEGVLADATLPGVLERAGRWHDAGKAHDAFLATLFAPLAEAERDRRSSRQWAKSPHREPHRERPRIRHELVSALLLLAHEEHFLADLDEPWRFLVPYLVAAHHGVVRLGIRSVHSEKKPADPTVRFALGAWDGDVVKETDLGDGVRVPATTLDLAILELGLGPDGRKSWSDRARALLEAMGPFRLAYLEALVRAADARASAQETTRARAAEGETRA